MAPPKQPAAGMRSIASFFAPKAKAPPKEQLPGIANGAIAPDPSESPADSPPSVLTLHGQPSALAPLEELLSVELNFSNLGGILQTLLKTAHAQQVQAQAAVGREGHAAWVGELVGP